MNDKTQMPQVGTTPPAALYVALELSRDEWRLCFSNGSRQRQVKVAARSSEGFLEAVATAKARLGVPVDALP